MERALKYSRKSLSMNNVSDNILWRDFTATNPNKKWTTDITYIWVRNKWMYLATVMDLYSRKNSWLGIRYKHDGKSCN